MWIILIVITLSVFVLFAYDKHCAVNAKWRVPESVLLLAAFSGGSLGADPAAAGKCPGPVYLFDGRCYGL